MVVKFAVEGYLEFKKTIADLESKSDPLFVLFSGSKDSTGKSWCPDCVAGSLVTVVSLILMQMIFHLIKLQLTL